MVEKITTSVYKTHGFKFNTYKEAKDFENRNIFIYNGEAYDAINIEDVRKYEKLFKENQDDFIESYSDLVNSNSMTAIYKLLCMRYVLIKNNMIYKEYDDLTQ